MSDKLKTLAEIWEAAGRKPVKVVNSHGYLCILIGIWEKWAWLLEDADKRSTGQSCCDVKEWKLHKPEPKKLWPAIVQEGGKEYNLTWKMYGSLEEARNDCDDCSGFKVIRLATAKDFAEGFQVEDEG